MADLTSTQAPLQAVLARLTGLHPEELIKILDSSSEALIAFDADRRILHANPAAEELFGYGRGALDGGSTDDLVVERLRQPSAPPMAPVADVMRVNLPGLRRDGTELAIEWVFGSVARAPNGVWRDVLGRDWRSAGPVFVMMVRDQQLLVDELERSLSVERAAREAAEAAQQRARASEERLRRLQRVTAALSEAATPVEVVNVVLDQALQALDATGGAVYVLGNDGRALKLLAQRGHPAEAVAPFENISVDLRSPLTDAAREQSSTFYTTFEECAARYPQLRENMRAGGFEASAAVPVIARGKVQGALGIRFSVARQFDANDRSLIATLSELCGQALDRSQLFAAETEARAIAESASRAKDEFLAMLGHELRNPLAPIVTALDLMRRRDSASSQRERAIIERQVTHLARLVDDLLDVSRITQRKAELEKELVELATVVATGVELSSALLEQRRHHLSVSVPRQGLVVDGDPTRLAQVVSNLLTNAAKYTSPGGHISIEAGRRADRIVLTVRDDGVGISPSMLPRIFDLFVQEQQDADRSRGGLGLGLTIVRSLVSMHGGTVSADSEGPGKGSVFTVDLPASPVEAASSASPSSQPQQVVGKGVRILIVDDNADAAEMLRELLGDAGFDTCMAHDGPAALESVDAFRPHAVLLDIGLPVMDGFEVARRLRDRPGGADLFLVAVTGYGQEVDRQRSQREGFHAHLVKPVEFEALTHLLGSISANG